MKRPAVAAFSFPVVKPLGKIRGEAALVAQAQVTEREHNRRSAIDHKIRNDRSVDTFKRHIAVFAADDCDGKSGVSAVTGRT